MIMSMLANLTNIINLPYLGPANQIQGTNIHGIHYHRSLSPIRSIIKLIFISHSFHFIFSLFGLIRRHKIHKLNRLLKLPLFKDGTCIEYLSAVEARLALPCCCCTPPVVPPESTSTHHYSILSHISQHNNSNGDNIHYFFTIIFTFTFSLLSFRISVH